MESLLSEGFSLHHGVLQQLSYGLTFFRIIRVAFSPPDASAIHIPVFGDYQQDICLREERIFDSEIDADDDSLISI